MIIGSGGFLGRWLLKEMRTSGRDEVVGVDRHGGTDAETGTLDILKIRQLESAIARVRPSAIVNCAGLISADPLNLFRVNSLGSRNIIDAVSKIESLACRIILIGSAAEYGLVDVKDLPVREKQPLNPVSAYGVSKAAQAFFARAAANKGQDIVIARLFNLIGPGLSEHLAPSRFARILSAPAEAGETVLETGYLGSRRDYIDVFQAVSALRILLARGKSGEEYNICSGRSWSTKEILDKLLGMSGRQRDVRIESRPADALEVRDIFGSPGKIKSLGASLQPPDLDIQLGLLMDYWRKRTYRDNGRQ